MPKVGGITTPPTMKPSHCSSTDPLTKTSIFSFEISSSAVIWNTNSEAYSLHETSGVGKRQRWHRQTNLSIFKFLVSEKNQLWEKLGLIKCVVAVHSGSSENCIGRSQESLQDCKLLCRGADSKKSRLWAEIAELTWSNIPQGTLVRVIMLLWGV